MTVPEENWVVEWTYSPADYFEEPMEISNEDYNLIIKDGKVEARTSCDQRPQLCDQLSMELEFRFQGIQLVSNKPYELSKPSITCPHHHSGMRIISVSETATISTEVDLTITDKNGNVVADTRKERIERKQFLGDLAVKYGSIDPLAGELLLHYTKAINDRDHFLVHLYDIIEALKRQFGKEARNTLQITKTQWNGLKTLANVTPLKEGRHRARAKPSELRDATKAEWNTAMKIAAEIVEKYLTYLDEQRT